MTSAANAGLSGWTFDPAECAAGTALTAGTIYLNEVFFEGAQGLLPATIYAAVGAAGVGASTGSFMGVYNVSQINNAENQSLLPIVPGTRLAVTADLGTAIPAGWGPTAGGVPLNWLAGLGELPIGLYWLAIVTNQATTQPVIAQGTGGGNVLLPALSGAAATLRCAVNGTGATALPATLTVASNTTTGSRPLSMALSG